MSTQPICQSQPADSCSASASIPGQVHQPSGLAEVHDPGHVTGNLAGPCTAIGVLPDPHCTPGSIDPAVNQGNIHSTICVSGYTKTVRPPASETEMFKLQEAYPAYSIPGGVTELDHLVPLELGGSNDAANLWPEMAPAYSAKDKVENVLRAAVCDGRVSLAAAQVAIASNWVTAEKVLGL